MDIEIKGEIEEDVEKIEYLDIESAILHRKEYEIEIIESEQGIEVFKNPEEDLEASEH